MRARYFALTAILLGLAIAPARVAVAATFRVTPIRIMMAETNSALLTLSNESDDELRFQISAFAWSQAAGTGEMVLEPTKEITFFPALLTLKARESRKVRIATTAKRGPVEQTFRVFFEELPSLKTAGNEGAQVKIITKMGVPVFVPPAGEGKAVPAIENARFADGKLLFDVVNRGNKHYSAMSIRALGLNATGAAAFDKKREGWYVLSGDTRTYDLPLTAEECAALSVLRVEMQTDVGIKAEDSLIKADLRASGSCKQP